MKASKDIIAVFLLSVFALSLPSVSFANGREAKFIKTLSDSAIALQPTRPDLSAALNEWANEEMHEKDAPKVPKTKEERQAMRAAHLKLLIDSSVALQASRPELAGKLGKRADWMQKKMAEHS